jgi:hypothetical protein
MTIKKEDGDKLTLVKLSGEGETQNGKMTRSHFFDFLKYDLDDYSDISFTPEEAKKISCHIQKLQTGSVAMVPLFCGGSLCPFKDRCVFFQMKKAPVGKQCLVEINMLKYWIMQYMTEYNVDPENFTEVGYCNELSEIEIYLWRLNMNLAKPANAELVIDQTVGVGQDGTPIIQKQLSPFMQQKEQLFNRKSRIVKLMVGDRQERYKKEAALKQREDKDPSSQQAEMRRQIEKLHREMNTIESRLSEDPKALSSHKEDILTPDAILDAVDDDE